MALLQVRAQNPKEPPRGPQLVSHTGGMNGRPPLGQTAAAKGTLLQACSQCIPPRPSGSTPPVRRIRVYTCRDTKETGGFLDLPEVRHSRAPLGVPGKDGVLEGTFENARQRVNVPVSSRTRSECSCDKRILHKLNLKGTPNSPGSRKEALGTCSIFRSFVRNGRNQLGIQRALITGHLGSRYIYSTKLAAALSSPASDLRD